MTSVARIASEKIPERQEPQSVQNGDNVVVVNNTARCSIQSAKDNESTGVESSSAGNRHAILEAQAQGNFEESLSTFGEEEMHAAQGVLETNGRDRREVNQRTPNI